MPNPYHALDPDPAAEAILTPLAHPCPTCHAPIGTPCTGHPTHRWMHHTARHALIPFTAAERRALIADPYTDLLPYEGTDL